jgi:hypothetical protein
MAEKYLYEKFAEDKRIYNLNQGYWKRKLQSRLREKLSAENVLFKNIDASGKKLYDANPIFTFINSQQTKGIRIIQDDIKRLSESKNFTEKDLIDAWLDKISIHNSSSFIDDKRGEIDELVIALFLTKETVEKTMKLIYKWLNNELNTESIERILRE